MWHLCLLFDFEFNISLGKDDSLTLVDELAGVVNQTGSITHLT